MIPVFKNRESFTLIELILVIVIMGIVYSFIGNTIFKKENSIIVKLNNLPEIARDLKKNPLEFIIYGRDCTNLIWIYNREESLDVEYEININAKDLKPYRFNNYGELDQFEFLDFRADNRIERVCFKFETFKNSSNSSYIIEDEKTDLFYLFRPYFRSVEIFKSLESAKDSYLAEELNPESL